MTSIDDLPGMQIRYKKPLSIKSYEIPAHFGNPALREHYKLKEHHRQKYEAKYMRSKWMKRMYE